jgi:tripartite-type tricarboxylate transporter receptor subunit TctC
MSGRPLLRSAFAAACAWACVFNWAGGAAAQGYPNRPVRFIVGFPPGGSTDVAARVITPRLAERIGQPVLIDIRAGAGGSIAVDAIVRSAPDGYTIGFGASGALTINTTLQSLPYDPVRDIAPVTLVATTPMLLAAGPATPVQSLRELLAYARPRPGRLEFATGGTGTAMHLSGAMLNALAGVELVHVPFKGNSATAAALIGGQVPLAVLDLTSAQPFLRAGRMRALAVTSARRTALAPGIPTMAEAGVPGFDVVSWLGIIAPAGTPSDVVTYLNAELVGILTHADSRERLVAAGLDPVPSSQEEFGALVRAEIPRLAKLIRESGVRGE